MRTLTNIGLTGDFALGEDGWDDEMNANLLKLSVLVQGGVNEIVSATPGAPVDNDVYIFDETHATEPNAIAVYDDGAWVYYEPVEGWAFYNKDAQRIYIFNGTEWVQSSGGSANKFRVGAFATTGPTGNEVLALAVPDVDVTFPANFTTSKGVVGTNPTVDYVLTVKAGATTIGTVTISTTGVFTFATSGGTDKAVAAGTVIQVIGQSSTDATIANLAITLVASED